MQSQCTPIAPPDATGLLLSAAQYAVRARALAFSQKMAVRAEAEHCFYRMTRSADAPEGEYVLRSPNLDASCRYPSYVVDIIAGTCTCPAAETHVARLNDDLRAVGLPPSVCCAHVGIVVEKLAAGWETFAAIAPVLPPAPPAAAVADAPMQTLAAPRVSAETRRKDWD